MCLVTGSECNLRATGALFHRPELVASLKYSRERVEDANGFELATGASLWSYMHASREDGDAFDAARRSGSKVQCAVLARCSEGFRGVKCLVDVGGGVGWRFGGDCEGESSCCWEALRLASCPL